MAKEFANLTVADLAVVGLYLIIILFVGLAAMLREKRSGAAGYFLAGNTVPWYQVGASVFASNIGSQHFVGLAGTGAASGYAVVLYEWTAGFHLLALAYLFLPVYLSSAVFTMPEYIGRRFQSNRIYNYFTVLTLVMIMFIQIPGDMFAGSVFLQTILKWNLYSAVFLLMGITVVYTIAGGLAAVVYTETFQTVLIVMGGIILAILGFKEIGGYQNLGEKFMNAISNDSLTSNNTCGIPKNNSLHLYRDVHDDLPFLGFVFGFGVSGLWYWAANQVIVQRSLACKNLAHGQGGLIMASLFKISPMFLMVMPGMISRILYTDQVACSHPDICNEICGNPNGCTNIAYPLMVVELLPSGLRGLLTAVMLSAIMSSLASSFNSASTIFTLDFWVKFRNIPLDWRMNQLTAKQRRKNDLEVMFVGRLIMVIFMICGGLWTPVVERFGNNGQLFVYISAIWGDVTAPLIAVFVLALFWHKVTEPGIFWSLMIGLFVSVIRIILEIFAPNPRCGDPDTRPAFISAIMINYFYFFIVSFWVTLVFAVIISLFTTPLPESNLYRLTFWTRHSKEPRESNEESPLVDNEITQSSRDGSLIVCDDSCHGINDTEHTVPASDLSHSHQSTTETQEEPNETPNIQEEPSKFKKYFYWFLGVSTIDGTPIPTETQEEREHESQKRLDIPLRVKAFVAGNWAWVLGIYVALYVVYW